MKDTFTQGFLAGVTSGCIANLFSLFFAFLSLSTLSYADWTGIIVFGHTPPFSTGEFILSLAVNIGLLGVMGSMFIYLIPLVHSTHIFFKGWVFSSFAWLLIYSVTTLFKVEGLLILPLNTVLSNLITASIYGLVLAQTVKNTVLAGSSRKDHSFFGIMAPAMKPVQPKDDDPQEPPTP